MQQGFSGGFFLPAQRSMHCKGGFFASDQQSGSIGSKQAGSSLRRLHAPISREHHRRRRNARPEDEVVDRPPVKTKSSVRFIRPRHERLAAANAKFVKRKQEETSTKSNNQGQSRRSLSSLCLPDVNSKFKLAMQELHQIKDEYTLKEQRQKSAPALNCSQGLTGDARPSAHCNRTKTAPLPSDPPKNLTTATEPTNLNSPRQRLLVAEMVMRKLYKNNLSTEQIVARLEQENAALLTRIAEFEDSKSSEKKVRGGNQSDGVSTLPDNSFIETRPTSSLLPQISHPPTRERIERLDQQQLDYLRHLAAEQDKTIASLQSRIESLTQEVAQTKKEPSASGRSKMTPRGLVGKLQNKLHIAVAESERHQANYCKMKADFQRLLSVKTTTLCENPAVISTGARELLQLMHRKMIQLEQEHSTNVSLYNEQLYAVEQQTCESFAQKKLLEREMARIAQDVQHRDELDLQIEKCMVGVFDRLHHVEAENFQLKGWTQTSTANTS